MADLTGIINLRERPDYEVLQRKQVRDLVSFLGSFGISSDSIHPSYCVGGRVSELTSGKYTFPFIIPEDSLSKSAFLEAGVPEENLIADSSRDTLLSLYLHRPTGWAYRNEVNVNIGKKGQPTLLDVGTLEYFLWNPLFNDKGHASKNIVGLEEMDNGISICALGLERLAMAINGLNRVQDVDYIQNFYSGFRGTILQGESLRALHRIYSDIQTMDVTPGRHQKEKIKRFIGNLCGVDIALIRDSLEFHSKTQPWHDNLSQGIEPTIARIEQYRKAVSS